MAKWYYQLDSKVHGPVEISDIAAKLKAGELSLADMVYMDGDERWRVLVEIPEIEKRSSDSTRLGGHIDLPNQKTVSSHHWVLLIKIKADRETRFVQKGPFDQETVIEKLNSKQIKFSDYAWKPGFKEWMRIGALDQFDRRKGRAGSSADRRWISSESAPTDAEGEDLVADTGVKPLIPVSPRAGSSFLREDATLNTAQGEAALMDEAVEDSDELGMPRWPKPESLAPRFGWAKRKKIVIASIAVLFLAVLSLYLTTKLGSTAALAPDEAGEVEKQEFSSERADEWLLRQEARRGKGNKNTMAVKPVAVVEKAVPVKPSSESVKHKISKKKRAPRLKTELSVDNIGAARFIRLNKSLPNALQIISDVPLGQLIEVTFEGKPGEIFDSPGFLANYKFSQNSKGVTVINFTAKRIPKGNYRILVKSGKLHSSLKSLRIGNLKNLAKVQKRWSFIRNREKLKLYYRLKSFDQILEKLAKQKVSRGRALSEIKKLKEKEFHQARKGVIRTLAYPQKWKQLRRYVLAAEKLLAKKDRMKRTMASDPAIKLRVNVKALKKQAGKITIYR